ncbi:ASCH domain-containing protein [Paracoccus aurantiacus]|uniref:ASCH domain-containing protein n=1 Tax=Paracoccus aurantiacus TaxID=2599412 RepID=A0A5C6S973_9RHOB|nr:ASCH domain-containing protein [Paracoccus aurantiacus]TXB70924.1 ASCH domain-containing protein [Paracoccus aurantiacus]
MDPVGFTFGDSRELNETLIALVRAGTKTATCGALRDFDEGEEMPVVGRRDIALDWDGKPALLIETTEVTTLPFSEVPQDFALAEGEGCFDDWRQAHIAFFTRNGGYDPDMLLVCERFRLVEVLR